MTALRKLLLSFLIISVVFLFSVKDAFAVSITINNYPSQISTDPFDVEVYISGYTGKNYLRIDLYKEGTTNYFGETFNGTNWYGDSDGTQYFPIEGINSTRFQGKIGNPSLTKYSGPGNFKLRIRRYTSSGNQASGDQQNPVEVQINVSLETPTLTPSLVPTSTPSSAPTSTPSPKPPTPTPKPTATYKINEVKDKDGEVLSSVKVYVDGVYVHHYTPEVLTFCDGCQCDTYVNCSFGQHAIKLEKTGYEDWSKETTIDPNTSDEVSPVMIFSEPNPTSTPTVLIKPTPTPTQKISPTSTPKKSNQIATDSGEVLGEEVASFSAFYPYEATSESEKNEATPSVKNKIIPKIFLVSGLLLLFASACWLWYTFKYTS